MPSFAVSLALGSKADGGGHAYSRCLGRGDHCVGPMSGVVDIIGGTTVDIYVSVPRFPRGIGAEFGRSTLAQCDRAASLTIGGNGGLAAFMLGRLGHRARLYTRLGKDF